jgi:FKBP-type peptidyl-prolyl cis-trans isomerase
MTKEPINRAQRRRIEREAKVHHPTFWDSTFNRIWVVALAAVVVGVIGYAAFFKAQPASNAATTPPRPVQPAPQPPKPAAGEAAQPATQTPEPPKSTEKVDIKDVKTGTGPEVKMGDRVTVHYTGTLKDGTKFDSSRDKGTPFTFTVGRGVIEGWSQGVIGMKAGGRRTLVVPSSLGYGKAGSPPRFPPDATLTFDIEVLKIE